MSHKARTTLQKRELLHKLLTKTLATELEQTVNSFDSLLKTFSCAAVRARETVEEIVCRADTVLSRADTVHTAAAQTLIGEPADEFEFHGNLDNPVRMCDSVIARLKTFPYRS